MENEILVAILTKLVDEKISQMPVSVGPRGHRGPRGEDGIDFVFSEHEDQIRQWAKDFSLKFEDLTPDQIENLRGQKGRDGSDGRGFIFSEHESIIRTLISDSSLKFEDLSFEQIESLRGPRGRDGRGGKDGIGFIWEEYRERINGIIRETINGMSGEFKLKFSDLSEEDIQKLRGPRGRDGRDGRDFNFEEHREFFDSLKLKFTDLTEPEKESLKLHFSQLSEEEKSSLKLKFSDLTKDDLALIRGPRGPRGQRGIPGREGDIGKTGPRGIPGSEGLIGLTGLRGSPGQDGISGANGQDAPRIIAIEIEQTDNEIVFIFIFSDNSIIRTDRIEIPAAINVFNGGGGARRTHKMNYETHIDEVSLTLTYVGKAFPGATTSEAIWQIQRILTTGTETVIEFADGDDKFDNIWTARAGLTYT